MDNAGFYENLGSSLELLHFALDILRQDVSLAEGVRGLPPSVTENLYTAVRLCKVTLEEVQDARDGTPPF